MFKSGMPVKGNDFIDRKQHLKTFKTYIDNNQHIMIKAPRRFGKTSLVVQLFNLYQYNKIYIDIKRATTLKKLAEQIIDEAYSNNGISGIVEKAKDSISSILKQLKGTFKIDIHIAELTIEILEKNQKNQLNEVDFFLHSLEIVEKLAHNQGVNVKFALDEFQDILSIADESILDKMRATIQHHQNVTYIFLGSIESIMNKIFSSKSSAFFHFARVMELGGLEIKELEEYTKSFFISQKIQFDDSLISLVHFLEGHPYYSAKTFQTLYYKILDGSNSDIKKENCMEALTIAFYETKPYLEEIIEKIKQKKYHHSVIWGLANNCRIEAIDSPTLYKTYKSLENMGYIIKQERGEYIISDIFLKTLLQQNNDVDFAIENKINFAGINL